MPSATAPGRVAAGLSTPTNRGGGAGSLAPACGFGKLGFSSVSTMAAPVVTGGSCPGADGAGLGTGINSAAPALIGSPGTYLLQ